MNKMNNKGFLLAESLIVSTFVLTVLIYLFAQFKNLMIEYKKSYIYNSVEDIYNLGSVASFLTKNKIIIEKSQKIYEKGYCTNIIPSNLKKTCTNLGESINADYILFTDSNMEDIKNNENNYNQDIIDFVRKVSVKKTQGKGRLVAKFKNGKFATIAIENSIEKEEAMIKNWSEDSNEDFHNVEYKNKITNVIFEDNISVQENQIYWDVSDSKNNTVIAWTTLDQEDASKYILHIGAETTIIANTNSSYLFDKFENIKTINFKQNFDTKNATNMNNMFSNCPNLETIYLKIDFDTNNVITSDNMFSGTNKLVGGKTAVETKKIYDKTYAKIDSNTQEGYFTQS